MKDSSLILKKYLGKAHKGSQIQFCDKVKNQDKNGISLDYKLAIKRKNFDSKQIENKNNYRNQSGKRKAFDFAEKVKKIMNLK